MKPALDLVPLYERYCSFALSKIRASGIQTVRARLPSNYKIHYSMKNVDVRRVKICVRKLAANYSGAKCAALPW
jgi:hypothetical protein